MPNTLAQTLQAGLRDDPRNKVWEDLNYDQKTERLMEVVTRLHETVQQQAASIHQLNQQLCTHEHDEKGVPFTRDYLGEKIKQDYRINIPYTPPYLSNPLNVRALKSSTDITETERPY